MALTPGDFRQDDRPAMTSTLDRHEINTPGGGQRDGRRLALAVMTMGARLGLNTVLGPLVTDTIRYPFSQSLRNQTIGLEAESMLCRCGRHVEVARLAGMQVSSLKLVTAMGVDPCNRLLT